MNDRNIIVLFLLMSNETPWQSLDVCLIFRSFKENCDKYISIQRFTYAPSYFSGICILQSYAFRINN